MPGEKLTRELIAAAGDEVRGASYRFIDPRPIGEKEERAYFLEDVDLRGHTTFHGPVFLQWLNAPSSSVGDWMDY